LVRIRTDVRGEGNIRWVALTPLGSVRHGLGLHLLGLANPYTVPRWGLRRILRRIFSVLGTALEFGTLPSLVAAYLTRVGGRLDVVIGEGPWEVAFALLLRSLGRARVVVYDDIDYAPGFQPISRARRRLVAAIERFGIRRADLVISVGERLARLRRAQGARQVQVIPNGADVDRFAVALPQRGAAGRRSPTLIYIGYLGAWAGVDLVLDAVAIAAHALPGLRLILLGHGTPLDLAALRTGIQARGVESAVEFRGEVAYRELPVQLAEADLGLAMFRPLDLTRFAFPLKVVEYMAAGLPVLTTADTEAADLVTRVDAGAVVPFDASAVAEAIVETLHDSEKYRRYSENATACSKAYDWQRIMGEYYSRLTESFAGL
jgi:glycosyltransferase involved in cell wall biosynthesis